MKDSLFNKCYNIYLAAKSGVPFWDNLAIDVGYPSKEAPDGELLRCAVKGERRKRKLPAKGAHVNKSNSDNPADYIDKIEHDYSDEEGGESSIIMNFPEEHADKLKEIFEQQCKDGADILSFHGFNPDIWEVRHVKSNLWNMPIAFGGKIVCYQSKISIAPIGSKGLTLDILDKYFKDLVIGDLHVALKPLQYSSDGDVLEIDFADLHIGVKEVYETKDEIEARAYKVAREICGRCVGKKFSKIVIVLLGDVFHFDTKKRTTSSGTPLATNGMTSQEIFDIAYKMFVTILGMFSSIAPVEIVPVSGNHDSVTSYMLIKTLEAHFRNDDNITIDSTHLSRKTRKFGNTLVGFVHGTMSIKNMRAWLQVDARKEWGETKWSEIHTAHFHHQKGEEGGGIIIRYVSSLADTDEWHYEKGFIGARKGVMSFVWDLEDGIKEVWFTCVDN